MHVVAFVLLLLKKVGKDGVAGAATRALLPHGAQLACAGFPWVSLLCQLSPSLTVRGGPVQAFPAMHRTMGLLPVAPFQLPR